jgi:hypothetical protein
MSVKRYELTTKYRGNESWDELEENHEGAYVRYGDYAALEQRLIESERYGRQTDITIDNLEMKLAQMAAENAELISSSECLLHEASEVYRAYNKTQLPDGDLVDEQCLQMVYDAINATPTTDAFLAEVRASALDEFAKAQDEQAKKYYEMSPGCTAQDECQFAASQAWYFAECIRKGVQS